MQNYTEFENYLNQGVSWLVSILPNIITAILILVIGLWVVRFINNMVRKFFVKKDYDPTLESFLQSFISIALKAVLFVLVITQLGVQSSSLVAIVGAAGLAVGLALQGSLANFAGGVLILIFKPFKVGDFISAQGVDGTVKEITIFTTKLSTFGNQIAIVPNGQLSNNNIINFNAQDLRRDKIVVGIGYSANIKKAKEILLQICLSHPDILKEPAPEVYVENLGDSSVDLQLRFWAKNEHFWAAHFFVLEELKTQFDASGIEIPFPQRVIYQK
ncbi:mechanosensitive ion channel [Arenibacter sp. GZD96]|uniref:mechanosensitive ion channel family protein n=1 Tax=Aurantibrevibacter litoralis TaxID=3106030 RepID=UPI002AFFB03F|nr:mechanosensitive ion channel domain-containing protein [Arenibacter sp. GZD-96]MEA1784610.1 mechanosensitive ion channel [Arenibacter sp. GZD-96]